MPNDPSAIILGSGPAGVAAAFPLLASGVRVLMLDAGRDEPASIVGNYRNLHDVRCRDDQWKLIVGEEFEAFEDADAASPKFRVPFHRRGLRDFSERLRVQATNFTAIGTLATGGLANAWGAGTSRFDAADLADYPISLTDLAPSYRRISERIGISGSNDDMAALHGQDDSLLRPTERSDKVRTLLARYAENPCAAQRHGVRLGAGRNAVLTENRGARQGCVYCGLCLWGCRYGAIWSAQHDLQILRRHPNFRYRGATFATALTRRDRGWRVLAKDRHSGNALHFDGTRIFLACGALASAKLVLDALHLHDQDISFQTSPAAGFAVLLAERRFKRLEANAFALAQASFKVAEPKLQSGYASGGLFVADTIQAAEFLRLASVFSYPLARHVVRLMQPRLLIGNAYLAGAYSRHTLRLEHSARERSGVLQIVGNYQPTVAPHAAAVRTRLAAALKAYRAWLLPSTFRLTPPGADVHYAATVPMRSSPRPHEASRSGEIAGLRGVYAVDGSALTSLPPKPPTLTIMANADRIATAAATTISAA